MSSASTALGLLFSVLLLSIFTVACGSPTQPSSQSDRIAVYSGQWRGVIGNFDVVVQVHVVKGFGAPSLDGTGSAVNRTTGETTALKIFGSGGLNDDSPYSFFNINTADVVTAQGTLPGKSLGMFSGSIVNDRRTWQGGFRAWSDRVDFYDLFGVDEVPATFVKD